VAGRADDGAGANDRGRYLLAGRTAQRRLILGGGETNQLGDRERQRTGDHQGDSSHPDPPLASPAFSWPCSDRHYITVASACLPLSVRRMETDSSEQPSAELPSQPAREQRGLVHIGPHPIGTQRSPTVTNGASFAQVAGAILGDQLRVQNPDKDELLQEPSGISLPAQRATNATRGLGRPLRSSSAPGAGWPAGGSRLLGSAGGHQGCPG